jgi:hypothetical protein
MDKIGHPIWRKWGKEVYSGQLFPQKLGIWADAKVEME